MTPLLCPDWWVASSGSFSRTVTLMSGRASRRRCAVASPTIPPPMIATSTRSPTGVGRLAGRCHRDIRKREPEPLPESPQPVGVNPVDDDALLVRARGRGRLGLGRDEDTAGGAGRKRRRDELLEVALQASLERAWLVDRGRVDDDEGLAEIRW